MRRMYQDLARAAGVPDLVTRSISGHATEAMQQYYSTVADGEQRSALARVAALMQGKDAGCSLDLEEDMVQARVGALPADKDEICTPAARRVLDNAPVRETLPAPDIHDVDTP